MEMLKYVRDNDAFPDIMALETACAYAIKHNQFEILKYLHDIGCDWNGRTFAEAIKSNQIEVVKYLHENGCTWTSLTSKCAATQGNVEILTYLHDNNCPCTVPNCSYCS